MSATTAVESQAQNAIPHDYSRTWGDRWLDLVKKVFANPETRHNWLDTYAAVAAKLPPYRKPDPALRRTIRFHDRSLPLSLSSPIVLAAGANKFGTQLPSFSSLGLGGIVVGSATRDSRLGNPFRPRLRLVEDERALQNAMGLNNPGVEAIAREVDAALGLCHKQGMAVGISVADTPGITDEDAIISDLLTTFRRAYGAADWVELNLSCPNTGSDRLDTDPTFLRRLLSEVMEVRKALVPRKAVFVKLSPDLNARALENTLQIISDLGITGITLFNTFPTEKAKYLRLRVAEEELLPVTAEGRKGGLSGRILYKNTLPAVKAIRRMLPKVSIFASGGIDHGGKVMDLLEAGADAVQVYTVLVYRWNAVWKMNRELRDAMRSRGITKLEEDPE